MDIRKAIHHDRAMHFQLRKVNLKRQLAPWLFAATGMLICVSSLAQEAASPIHVAAGSVASMPIDGLVVKPRNLFDLQGRTLSLTPHAHGYDWQTTTSSAVVDCDKVLDYHAAEGPYEAK